MGGYYGDCYEFKASLGFTVSQGQPELHSETLIQQPKEMTVTVTLQSHQALCTCPSQQDFPPKSSPPSAPRPPLSVQGPPSRPLLCPGPHALPTSVACALLLPVEQLCPGPWTPAAWLQIRSTLRTRPLSRPPPASLLGPSSLRFGDGWSLHPGPCSPLSLGEPHGSSCPRSLVHGWLGATSPLPTTLPSLRYQRWRKHPDTPLSPSHIQTIGKYCF